MKKVRVFELGKEMSTAARKMENSVIIDKAKELGIEVKNHLSYLDEEDVARIRKALLEEPAAGTGQEVRVKSGVVRRRRGAQEVEVTPGKKEEEAPARRLEVVETPAEEGATEPVPVAAPEVEAEVAVPEAAVEMPAGGPELPAAEEAGAESPPEALPAAAEGAAAAELAAAEPAAPSPRKEEEDRQALYRSLLEKKRAKSPGREEFKATVVALPEEVEKPKVLPPKLPVRPGAREAPKDDEGDRPKKRGKRLIYDRRKDLMPALAGERDGMGRPMHGRRKRGKVKGEMQEVVAATVQKRTIRIEETITVGDLAGQMAIKSSLLLKKLFEQGVMVKVTDPLDYETAAIIASDMGYEVENVAFDVTRYLETEADVPESLRPRPPVVTIMGHVDHGKTSLLDHIQKTRIAAGEAGGITQRIGAYVVEGSRGRVTFIDTPGHEAFTAMRARGARVTDMVILVVAADDGVMPQTLEAIDHARAANVPLLVAVNKIDKPEANPTRVRQDLTEHGLIPEEWGGQTIFVDISAKTGQGVDQLLDMLSLQAEVLELKANPDKRARGTIVESRLEKGRGPVISAIVQEGTLSVGDAIVAGNAAGRVRGLFDDKGRAMRAVPPGLPAEIIGLDCVPPPSEMLYVVADEKTAKMIAEHREHKEREERLAKTRKMTFEQLLQKAAEGEKKVLRMVLKADTQGAIDAIRSGIGQIKSEQVSIEVIRVGVGVPSESDINLAMASGAIVLGFNVRAEANARALADAHDVQILSFNLIHEMLDKVKLLMEGKLEMIEQEVQLGRAEVRQVFNVSKIGKVAGCLVTQGKVLRSGLARVHRADQALWSGKLSSLKRFKEDVREVAQGLECGMSLDGFNDVQVGDMIEIYEIQKVAATL